MVNREGPFEEMLLKYRQAYEHCIDSSETESSGWLIEGIVSLQFCIAENTGKKTQQIILVSIQMSGFTPHHQHKYRV